jgi:hypothetical protein
MLELMMSVMREKMLMGCASWAADPEQSPLRYLLSEFVPGSADPLSY